MDMTAQFVMKQSNVLLNVKMKGLLLAGIVPVQMLKKIVPNFIVRMVILKIVLMMETVVQKVGLVTVSLTVVIRLLDNSLHQTQSSI
jgi:hypothetical protein